MESDQRATFDQALSQRIHLARMAQSLTLDQLAARSQVSRAMLSRIERGESSPSAALLVRIGSGLGLTLSALLAEEERGEPFSPRTQQPVWRDPETGYQRRTVSPRGTGSGFEIVEVDLPAGARVMLDTARSAPPLDQQIWLLDGEITVTLGDVRHRMTAGDCLQMSLAEPITYHNPGPTSARYAVVIATPPVGAPR